MPIEKPESCHKGFITVATDSTTYTRAVVQNTSTTKASVQPESDGCKDSIEAHEIGKEPSRPTREEDCEALNGPVLADLPHRDQVAVGQQSGSGAGSK